MSFLQQFSARPWAVALSHCCTCRIGMAPTQYLNVKCGGFTVSRGHFRNISNVVCIPHYHFPLNSITYSIKHFTPLFRKQKLSCLQHCFRTYSKSLMLYDSESDGYRNGGDLFPPVRKVLEELNIIRRSHLPGQYSKLLCPQCQGGSTRERSLSLYIGEDGVSAKWMCHRAKCGWSGGTKDGKLFLALENATSNVEATYAISNVEVADVISNVEVLARKDFTVENMQLEQISAEHLCCYFTSRRISGKTLQRNGVMQTTRNNKIFIAFTYRRNGKIVNCKYRDVEKRFFQEKHGEKIPYGLDDIKEARDIIIVEGEMDKLAMEEAGYRNCISVPDGAPPKVSTKELPPVEQDKKYQYLWNSKEYFEQASRIILATDADTAGQALAEELARRLGRERCWRVTWPRRSETTKELCKDANEVLIYFGQQALKEVIEGAELYPIQGLFRFSRFYDVIDAYYNRELGTELGVSTGWVGLDELYRVIPGELTLVTGVPNSGKSEWIDALLCNLNHAEGWPFVLCSMENKVQEHARKLLEKHIKKPFFHAKYGDTIPRLSANELEQGKQWLNENFFLIRYHYTKDFEADGEVKEGLYKCIERMVPDSVKQDEIHSKLLHFNESIGTFGMAMAVRGRARDPPAYWWQQFGSQCHELQKFAVRILSQTCSASGCERNWSVFERIHTKKRNRLEQKRLNDMVFVQYNLRLRRNQLMNKTPESNNIFLDDIDPSSDWVVETQPAAFDHEDLSWMDLDPEPHQENVATDAAQPAPVSLPSGPGESSQAQNPPVQSTHVESVESDDDSESDSDSSEASFQYADSDY